MLKHLFNIIFSLFGLIALFPILLGIAALIKREDEGPVFLSWLADGSCEKIS